MSNRRAPRAPPSHDRPRDSRRDLQARKRPVGSVGAVARISDPRPAESGSNAPFRDAASYRETMRDDTRLEIGETGFEPATARPPAGAIQPRWACFGVPEPD